MFGSNTIDFEVDITNEDIEVVSLWWSFWCSFSAVSTPIFCDYKKIFRMTLFRILHTIRIIIPESNNKHICKLWSKSIFKKLDVWKYNISRLWYYKITVFSGILKTV
jgi:hypothetical protein